MVSVKKLLYEILTRIDDRVIEVGKETKTLTLATSTPKTFTVTWYYRKWSSGKKEAWFNYNDVSIPVNTQHTNGYRSSKFTIPVPDIGFSSPKIYGVSHIEGTYASTLFFDVYNSTSKSLDYYVYSGATMSSSSSRHVDMHVMLSEG